MTKTDNPVGRLHMLLEKGKQQSGSGYLIWGNVLEMNLTPKSGNQIDEDTVLEIFYRVTQVRTLTKKAEESLRDIEEINHELYLTPFPRIMPVLRIDNFNTGNFEIYFQAITDGDMAILALGSEELSKRHIEPSIDEEELKEILLSVNHLFDEVQSSSLPKELKTYILTQLELIRRGINEYRITGVARLQEALATTIGSMLLNRDLINQSSDKPEVGRFANLAMRFASVVTFASDTTSLIDNVSKFLPLLLP